MVVGLLLTFLRTSLSSHSDDYIKFETFKNFIELINYGFICECNQCYWHTLETSENSTVRRECNYTFVKIIRVSFFRTYLVSIIYNFCV